MGKKRLDILLLDQNLVESRAQGQALIMAGKVLVKDVPVTKAGTQVDEDAPIRLKDVPRYVSRAGLKIEKAVKNWGFEPKNGIFVDIGASTGGFCDCLLQNGAKKVWAIDVGQDQLHSKLVQDPRIVQLDKTNFRHFDCDRITDAIDGVVMDVSFISILQLFDKIFELLDSKGTKDKALDLVFLIKPQFEVGRENIAKGGLVKDEAARKHACDKVLHALKEHQVVIQEFSESPIQGTTGNTEYLVWGKYNQK